MPEKKDIEAIEKMLLELGETELELGEINEQEYLSRHNISASALEIMDVEEAEPLLPEEEAQPGVTTATGDEDDFQELLKDIEIGLTEERELQEKMAAEEEAVPAPGVEPLEDMSITEDLLPSEGDLEPGEPTAAGSEEPAAVEAVPGLEDLLGEEAVSVQPEQIPEGFGEPGVSEESEVQPPEPTFPEEPAFPVEPELSEEQAPPEAPEPPEEALFPGEPAGEEQVPVSMDEDLLDLPVDFDMEDMGAAESSPFARDDTERAAEKIEAEQAVQQEEREEPVITGEAGEEAPPAVPREDSISIEESTVELEDLLFQEPEEEMPSPSRDLDKTDLEETMEAEPPSEAAEEPALPDLESKAMQEEAITSELPSIEDIGAESPPSEGVFETDRELPIESVPEHEQEVPEVEEIVAEESAAPEGEVMELTEEDIGQIKTKLGKMSPVVAAAVQDIIVKSSLPAESMKGIVELLILDAPEHEIIDFVEKVTGRKIAVPSIARPAPVVVKKAGVLGAFAENIGPFIRASMLVGAILIVLAALFFVFFWNPYNATRYYRQALLSVEKNEWAQVEEHLEDAASYQQRSPQFFHGIGQYDSLGWELMRAGQYGMAERVFERGILKELDKNQSIQNIKGVRNSRIFMRLAILFNILGRYTDSEQIYAFVLHDLDGLRSALYEAPELTEPYERPYIVTLFDRTDFIQSQKRRLRDYRAVETEEDRLRKTDGVTLAVAEQIAAATSLRSTDKYDFRMLRGENLLDGLAVDRGHGGDEDEKRDDRALVQFQRAAELKRGEAAPLYKQLQVYIRRDDIDAVNSMTDQIRRRFPKSRDEEVQTELARYLISYENFTIVRQLLLNALNKRGMVYPFPPAYAAFGDYYRAVGDNMSREQYLLAAVEAELARELPRTWNYRDRKLVSWTDQKLLKQPAASDKEQGTEVAARNVEFLFPWEERNWALLSGAYYGLGEIHAQRASFENVAQAIRYFRKAINPDPGSRAVESSFNADVPEATFSLAQLYFYRVKDYDNALKFYRAYERAMDENRLAGMDGGEYSQHVNDLYYNLGYLYYNQLQTAGPQSLSRALQYWSKLESLLPDNPHLHMAIGNTLLHRGAYESALGRYLYLAEVYDTLIDNLGEIKPWQDYDRRILAEAAVVYNNLGVAYKMLSERKTIDNYERNSLVALYKAGEYADILGEDRGNIQYNIYYIIHPDVVRSDMKINDDLSDNYRFSVQ